eukprot:2945867-Prorocentrum_lima.AAC.1
MTSSLVGSEMCIRDSPRKEKRREQTTCHYAPHPPVLYATHARKHASLTSVSYTHLTLPTICSV